MSEYINLGDVTYFGLTLFNPALSGMLSNADETPRYFLYRNASDTPSISANFISRAGLLGTYRGSGDITVGNGFAVGDYVEVHASGKVAGLQGRIILKNFVVGDVFNSNVTQWSGNAVAPANNNNPTVNIASLTGVPLANSINPTIQNAVWGARMTDWTTNNTTGSGLGRSALNTVNSNTVQWSGSVVQPTNNGLVPTHVKYWAGYAAQIDPQNLYPVMSMYGIWNEDTGLYDIPPTYFTNMQIEPFTGTVKVDVVRQSGLLVAAPNGSGYIPVNLLHINSSGQAVHNLSYAFNRFNNNYNSVANLWKSDTQAWAGATPAVALDGEDGYPIVASRRYWDTTDAQYLFFPALFNDAYNQQTSNLLNTNLSTFNTNGTVGSGLNKISANIYYAGIKFIKDSAGSRDEYLVQWFRNSLPLHSGDISNPALSVYKTSDGLALTQNNRLAVTSVYNGVLRYNETVSLAVSGEPYLAITSGIIDGALRTWSNPIGIDSL